MRFGIREVCDVDFYKYVNGVLDRSKPAFTIDTAKTSTLESATTTVYAQGGKGNARRMSWEGERTMTFTIEDALFTKESIAALIGESFNANGRISIKDTTTAGTYQIEAKTLIRDEEGEDKVATIIINKAKLQSNLNLPFSPTGDPLALTFTFDAFPDDTGEFMSITCDHFATSATADTVTVITVQTERGPYSMSITGANDLVLKHNKTTVTVGTSDSATAITNLTIKETDVLINGATMLKNGENVTIKAGSSSVWYVV